MTYERNSYIVYKNEIMKDEARTSFALYDQYRTNMAHE